MLTLVTGNWILLWIQVYCGGVSNSYTEVNMRKHKWRRRFVILVLLLVFGMIFLSPDRKENDRSPDVTAGRQTENNGIDADNRAGDDVNAAGPGEALAAPAANDSEEKTGEETIVGWMIDRIASGEVELSDESSIRQALNDAESELLVSLTEESKAGIVGFLQTLGNIGVETEDFIDQAKQKYQQYSVGIVEEANEAINDAVESAVSEAAQNFFDSIKEAVKDFFGNLIP